MLTANQLIAFEREIADAFNAGKIRAPIHLDGGNEQQLIDVFRDVAREDWVFCSWRSHYKALLHGIEPERVKAAIFAGRSIALCFPDRRFFSSAIVGGMLPVALGVAAGIKLRGGMERVHAFLGDMAAGAGTFGECAAYARGHSLPIRFIIEDNGLSVCTPTAEVWGGDLFWCSTRYRYDLPWPHSGAGKRIQF